MKSRKITLHIHIMGLHHLQQQYVNILIDALTPWRSQGFDRGGIAFEPTDPTFNRDFFFYQKSFLKQKQNHF